MLSPSENNPDYTGGPDFIYSGTTGCDCFFYHSIWHEPNKQMNGRQDSQIQNQEGKK